MIEDIDFLDDSTRPKADKLDITSDSQRTAGRHLAIIHDHFRDHMRVLRIILEKVENGEASPEELRDQTESLPMLHNLRRFGNLCGQHCQIIEMHHTIEDQALFPILKNKNNSLKLVVDRLVAEHVVVHELLLRLLEASKQLVHDPAPDNLAATRELHEAFEKVLLSHFGYEEKEMCDAIGFHNIRI